MIEETKELNQESVELKELTKEVTNFALGLLYICFLALLIPIFTLQSLGP